MKITIEIDTDNAAFEDDHTAEVARILRDLAKRVDGHPHLYPGHSQPLRDVNGNQVGWMNVTD